MYDAIRKEEHGCTMRHFSLAFGASLLYMFYALFEHCLVKESVIVLEVYSDCFIR